MGLETCVSRFNLVEVRCKRQLKQDFLDDFMKPNCRSRTHATSSQSFLISIINVQ